MIRTIRHDKYEDALWLIRDSITTCKLSKVEELNNALKRMSWLVDKEYPRTVDRYLKSDGFEKEPTCPECGETLENEDYSYCPYCGQRLDWNPEIYEEDE
jgi:tRNA(Ile2) C34 agmatinyltransferase TiaS